MITSDVLSRKFIFRHHHTGESNTWAVYGYSQFFWNSSARPLQHGVYRAWENAHKAYSPWKTSSVLFCLLYILHVSLMPDFYTAVESIRWSTWLVRKTHQGEDRRPPTARSRNSLRSAAMSEQVRGELEHQRHICAELEARTRWGRLPLK